MLKRIITVAAALAALFPTLSFADDAADLARYREAEKIAKERLANFDDLDFNVFSNQKWDELKKSHAPNIKVHNPDGSITVGLEDHIKGLSFMFSYAPDMKVTEHPVRVAQGDWTSVIGNVSGSFSKPMVVNGKTIPPTGKSFNLQMVTVGHWTKDGVMDEEYLFMDTATMMRQLGLTS